MQATSKVPISHNVVSFWKQHSWHWTITPPWRQERVDNSGTLGFAHPSHNLRKDRLYKAVVSSFYFFDANMIHSKFSHSNGFDDAISNFKLIIKLLRVTGLRVGQLATRNSQQGQTVHY